MGPLILAADSQGMDVFFTSMVGSVAVILVVAAFIGANDLISKFFGSKKKWIYSLPAGVLGGMIGIYGNIAGIAYNGAIISVRDIGPMLAGFTAGPLGGVIAGVICGVHRVFMGGDTAYACVVATCCIGLSCGLLSWKFHDKISKPWFAFPLGVAFELLHLGLVLLMVKPFDKALGIVKAIALPFVLVNAVGFTLMVLMISYIDRQKKIALEQSRLQSELEVATVIQRSLLPVISDTYPGKPEIGVAASMEPAKQVGGDFYDVFFVDKDRIAFVIADVSGKGVPAALFMATSKTTIQNCVRDIPSLKDAVAAANNSLCGNNEAEMFVTVWIGVLDIPAGLLTFISAGHNAPVLMSENGAEFLKRKPCFVLAGMEGVRYREETVELKKGDRLFLYTDGITEAHNSENELYGDERLLGLLNGLGSADENAVIESVKKDVAVFANGREQFDDMTMLCVMVK